MTERVERLAATAPDEHSHNPQPRYLAEVVGVGVLVESALVVVVGVITDGINTPLRERLTPLLGIDYPIWGLNAALMGALAGLSVHAQRTRRGVRTSAVFGGGFLAVFAVSCPLCNGLLVAAFGAGGVLSFIEPARPFLGGAATLFLTKYLGPAGMRIPVRIPHLRSARDGGAGDDRWLSARIRSESIWAVGESVAGREQHVQQRAVAARDADTGSIGDLPGRRARSR